MPKTVLDPAQLGLTELDHDLNHHTELPRTAISDFLDNIIDKIGYACSWLWLVAVGVIICTVATRYVFGLGTVMLEEIQWHLVGAAWLVGLSYTIVHDDHVRVDIIHENLSIRSQAKVEFFGILFLLLPFLLISLWEMMPYAMSSFAQNETSQSPNGLPFRWVLKSVLPFSMVLLIMATSARLIRVSVLLFSKRPNKNNNVNKSI